MQSKQNKKTVRTHRGGVRNTFFREFTHRTFPIYPETINSVYYLLRDLGYLAIGGKDACTLWMHGNIRPTDQS